MFCFLDLSPVQRCFAHTKCSTFLKESIYNILYMSHAFRDEEYFSKQQDRKIWCT